MLITNAGAFDRMPGSINIQEVYYTCTGVAWFHLNKGRKNVRGAWIKCDVNATKNVILYVYLSYYLFHFNLSHRTLKPIAFLKPEKRSKCLRVDCLWQISGRVPFRGFRLPFFFRARVLRVSKMRAFLVFFRRTKKKELIWRLQARWAALTLAESCHFLSEGKRKGKKYFWEKFSCRNMKVDALRISERWNANNCTSTNYCLLATKPITRQSNIR